MRPRATFLTILMLILALIPHLASAQPTLSLTLNGIAADAILTMGDMVSIETEPDAQLILYSDANCTIGENPLGVNSYSYFSPVPEVDSVRAVLIGDESVTSECLSITWVEADPPVFTINGMASNANLTVGEPAVFQTQTDAYIELYTSANCTGTGTVVPSGWSVNPIGPGQQSGRAFLTDGPGIVSACYVATWSEAPPAPPSLTINGVAGNANLSVGDTAVFETDSTAYMNIYDTLDCTGTSLPTSSNSYSYTPDTASVASARASLVSDSSITSDCLSVTWSEAPPAPPSLTINGVAGNANLSVGDAAVFETDSDAYLETYNAADCSGVGTNRSNSYGINPLGPGTLSAMAFLTADSSITSECRTATWTEAATETETPTGTPTETPTETPISTTVIPTSTPEGTSEATVEPTPALTEPPAQDPTAPPSDPPTDPRNDDGAVVTGLPSTGSGSNTGSLWILIAALVAMASIGATTWRERSRR